MAHKWYLRAYEAGAGHCTHEGVIACVGIKVPGDDGRVSDRGITYRIMELFLHVLLSLGGMAQGRWQV